MNSLKSSLTQLKAELTTKEIAWNRSQKQLHQQITNLKQQNFDLQKKLAIIEPTSGQSKVFGSVWRNDPYSASTTASAFPPYISQPPPYFGENDPTGQPNLPMVIRYTNNDTKQVNLSPKHVIA
jgi:hypothetical protein